VRVELAQRAAERGAVKITGCLAGDQHHGR
jgi:hypothetical protein